jgi:hypothetical protein
MHSEYRLPANGQHIDVKTAAHACLVERAADQEELGARVGFGHSDFLGNSGLYSGLVFFQAKLLGAVPLGQRFLFPCTSSRSLDWSS